MPSSQTFDIAGFGVTCTKAPTHDESGDLPTTVTVDGKGDEAGLFLIIDHIANRVFRKYRGDSSKPDSNIVIFHDTVPASEILGFRDKDAVSFEGVVEVLQKLAVQLPSTLRGNLLSTSLRKSEIGVSV